jgi:hypothetical protein
VESFGDTEPAEKGGPKAFIRGGTIQPGSTAAAKGAVLGILKLRAIVFTSRAEAPLILEAHAMCRARAEESHSWKVCTILHSTIPRCSSYARWKFTCQWLWLLIIALGEVTVELD